MNRPHQLILLSDLDRLDLVEESFGYSTMLVSPNNPLGKKAIFKCKDVSICELFGYLLAQLLDAPTPDFLGLWFDREVEIPGGYHAPANHIAILIELLTAPRRMPLEHLALRDRSLTARILALCYFDRFEWPEVFSSDGSVVVLDLERIGPIMQIDEFTSGSPEIIQEQLRYRQDEYVNASDSDFSQLLCEAKRLQVLNELRAEFGNLSDNSSESIRRGLSLAGHPFSNLLSAFFQSAITKRQALCATKMGIRPWPAADWESVIKCADYCY